MAPPLESPDPPLHPLDAKFLKWFRARIVPYLLRVFPDIGALSLSGFLAYAVWFDFPYATNAIWAAGLGTFMGYVWGRKFSGENAREKDPGGLNIGDSTTINRVEVVEKESRI